MIQKYPEMNSGEHIHGYVEEQEAERILYDAHIIASEVSAELFASEDAAQNYIDHRIKPFLREISPAIRLAATGEGVTLPDLRFMHTEDLAEGQLVVRGMETKDNADIPLVGYWKEFEYKVVPKDYGAGYGIEMAAILTLPGVEEGKLNDYIRITITRFARVLLGEDGAITSVRLDQLRRVEELVMLSSQPEKAQKLKKLLLDIDKELQQETHNFRDLENMDALRALGLTASEMLASAGNNHSEREEIINLLTSGLGLTHKSLQVQHVAGSSFTGKQVASEKDHTLPGTLSLTVENQGMLQGTVLGIIAPKKLESDAQMPPDIPHFVIRRTAQELQGDLYVYVPFTQISSLRF